MFELVSPDLPDRAQASRFGGGAFVLVDGVRTGMGLLAEVDITADFPLDAGSDTQLQALNAPIKVGYYYHFPFPDQNFVRFDQDRLAITEDPASDISIPIAWLDLKNLVFITKELLTFPYQFRLVVNAIVPGDLGQNQWTIDLGLDIDVDSVLVQGNYFTEALSVPSPGEFIQSGSQITLFGNASISLTAGEYIALSGLVTLQEQKPTTNVAIFDLNGVDFVDGVQWMGKTYTPAEDIFVPVLRDLLFSSLSGRLALFTSCPLEGIQLLLPEEQGGIRRPISSTFDRFTNPNF